MSDCAEIVSDSCETLPQNNAVKVCDNICYLDKREKTISDCNLYNELAPRHSAHNYRLDSHPPVNFQSLSTDGMLLDGQHSIIPLSTFPPHVEDLPATSTLSRPGEDSIKSTSSNPGEGCLATVRGQTVTHSLGNITSASFATVSGNSPSNFTSAVSGEFPCTSIPPTTGGNLSMSIGNHSFLSTGVNLCMSTEEHSSMSTGGHSSICTGSNPSMSSEKLTLFPAHVDRKLGMSLPGYSGCGSNKSDNLCNSQEKLDGKPRNKTKDTVNGLVHMASIMAATLETAKSTKKSFHSPKNVTKSSHSPKTPAKVSHSPMISTKLSHSPIISPKSSHSTLEPTLVDQREKRPKTDFLNDRIDSQNLWETFKMLAEESLRKFSDKKPSRWKTVRHMVQWTPFIQTYKKKKYPWVQLAGHSGNFKAGTSQGTVLKKLCPQEEACYQSIMKDANMKDLVPQYYGSIKMEENEHFIELQDCLSTFTSPCIMDCKVGLRTYLEEELTKARQKPTLRADMYEKMVSVDPTAPTEEEHRQQGVTKPRYMIWRETISSTATLGFRIEGIKKGGVDFPPKDFKTTKTRDQLLESFRTFLTGYPAAAAQYIQRLQVIKKSLEKSPFFNSQEVIGSSLLFVHDHVKASIWMIDFGKTVPVPDDITMDHRSAWQFGNHEDGYLAGLDNIINIFQEIASHG